MPEKSLTRQTPQERASAARERLLAAADELFYAEGVHTVGIDRVIERAGVAKATLYSAFGSKEELVRAYLTARHEARKAQVQRVIGRHEAPRDKVLALFDSLAKAAADPRFRGCAFVNANAESPPGDAVAEVSETHRAWVRSMVADLARAAGARDPDRLGAQLMLLYDGALVAAWMDRDPGAVLGARAVAEGLLDATG